METFEIHLTSDESIHENAKKLSLKTITVDLIGPNFKKFRTEHMTSYIKKFASFLECKKYVEQTIKVLDQAGSKIIRAKIETPYSGQILDALYIESHVDFKLGLDSLYTKYPMSINVRKPNNIMSTSREYKQDKFAQFYDLWKNKGIVELCLFDSWVEEDFDWFALY